MCRKLGYGLSTRKELRSTLGHRCRCHRPERSLSPTSSAISGHQASVASTVRQDGGMDDSTHSRLVARADPDTPILDDSCRLVDFWRWAYSDLVSNDVRGVFAEFIVGNALGALNEPRTSWAAWDLTYGAARIEVKATGDVQAWAPTGRTPRPSWSIGRRLGWDAQANTTTSEPLRSAHLYVLCHWRGTDPSPLNPASIEPWDFYVVPTRILNDKYSDRKTMSMSLLGQLLDDGDATAAKYSTLKEAVDRRVIEESTQRGHTRP